MKPVACFLVLVLTVPALAQHRETQTVEVVEVPVYVTGPAGSVTGLTRDNFELLINGKPQTIDYFDVVDFGALTAEKPYNTGAPRDMRQRRLYLLLFDLLFSTPNSIRRAQAAAEKLLQNAGGADEFGVATFTFNRGVEIIVPFTRDRMTTTRAIRSLRTSAAADTLRLSMSNEEIAGLQQASSSVRTDQTAEAQSGCGSGSVCADLFADRARGMISDQIEAITALAPRLRALEGQKHVVLLTNGFPAEPMTGVGSRPRSVDVQRMEAPSNTAKMVLRSGAPASGPIERLERLHTAFGAAGVFLDAVDTMGLRPDGIFEEKESLVMMARETGGDVIENDNDLSQALRVLTDRQRVVYLLGFHAHGTRRKENAITVRLQGVEGKPDLRYRRAYSTVIDRPPKQIDAIRLADILINDIAQHGIELVMKVDRGKVDMKIPLVTLLPQFEKQADLDVMLYIFANDRAIAVKEKRVRFEHERAAAAGRQAALHFTQQFDLPPGQYVAKGIVMMDGSTAIGFARENFTNP